MTGEALPQKGNGLGRMRWFSTTTGSACDEIIKIVNNAFCAEPPRKPRGVSEAWRHCRFDIIHLFLVERWRRNKYHAAKITFTKGREIDRVEADRLFDIFNKTSTTRRRERFPIDAGEGNIARALIYDICSRNCSMVTSDEKLYYFVKKKKWYYYTQWFTAHLNATISWFPPTSRKEMMI